jgi:hypothetical protein
MEDTAAELRTKSQVTAAWQANRNDASLLYKR